ncbi:DUF1476 domain-containing protein [Yoonia sp. I 8.24]|uniref:DUF1476 domain-containing protein n=1 Tax=Yoonia sp. I 8.24 TaxID=1537229 RepID=UPI001EDE7ED0|nr:DUF1476 domain-containing protein [Yoonia sp. I 8.24]MCG3267647.1 DUF1476 domain-containing protein [Yoonia sp. I 8.24]
MNTLDERERAFEAKFAHDAEMQFNATARRNHLLGLWAATLMQKSDAETDIYTTEIVKLATQSPSDDALAERLTQDLGGRVDQETLQTQMTALMLVAKQQITAEN